MDLKGRKNEEAGKQSRFNKSERSKMQSVYGDQTTIIPCEGDQVCR
jgi:hypothetical protein